MRQRGPLPNTACRRRRWWPWITSERYAALFHYLGLASLAKVETILRDVLTPVPADARTFCDSLAVRSPSCR